MGQQFRSRGLASRITAKPLWKGNALKAVGLFAGIGGFELALSSAGISTTLLADIDPVAQAVLAARFPDAEVRGDVTSITSLPSDAEIVVAGFPCQNLSMAGDKTGIDGKKSNVVRHLFDLISSQNSPTVVIENVPFMLHLDGGRAMRWLVERFEELQYQWAYRVLDTAGFGLPQRRRRVYFVASRTLNPHDVLFGLEDGERSAASSVSIDKPVGFYWTEGRTGVGLTSDGVPPIKAGSGVGIASPPAVLFPDGEVLTPSIEAAEALQGFERGWTKVADGRERNVRWRLVGNAVSVPVATWVAKRLANPTSKPAATTSGTPMEGGKWPNAAYGGPGCHMKLVASEHPVEMTSPSLAEFREDNWKPLSFRAINGFISRAEEGGLSFPPGFLDALRATRARLKG
jgi:DNA (cytosine-5)-methyltransferase 1